MDLCRHEVRYGCQREDFCFYAHSLIELKVWMMQAEQGELPLETHELSDTKADGGNANCCVGLFQVSHMTVLSRSHINIGIWMLLFMFRWNLYLRTNRYSSIPARDVLWYFCANPIGAPTGPAPIWTS